MNDHVVLGILAHVDAGKTTLTEALLYSSGKLRRLGRVDRKDSFLDNNAIERERGITVFSKQARFNGASTEYILLDTPGHLDLSAEAERTLSLLDYAILVVSASDGVQEHTRTLWTLLEHYNVPTLIFVNKTDLGVCPPERYGEMLSRELSHACVLFSDETDRAELDERIAMLDEKLLEQVLSGEPISDAAVSDMILKRKLFPCLLGSALKLIGTDELLAFLDRYLLPPQYPNDVFGAKVYKISHSDTRLTYMKLVGGCAQARDELTYSTPDGQTHSEKINQLRLYSGSRFEQVDRVYAGDVCAVTGLTSTYAGQGLGSADDDRRPILDPVLSYRIVLPEGCDPHVCFGRFKELEEEEPSLHMRWNEALKQIEVRLMGDVQLELLKRLISDRFSVKCELDEGKIMYKETVSSATVGVGHFEPLRHYAEVQLLLEPLPRGSGLIFDSDIPANSLDPSWQRAILSALSDKEHKGTLIGAPLTDTRITLIAAKTHLKHTEGGDIREASSRAIRHALMKAGCTLLEPYYRFRLSLPDANVGRALSELQMRYADITLSDARDGITTVTGRAPVSTLRGYHSDVIAYTHGKGRLTCFLDGYEPCHNTESVVEACGYRPEADAEAPPHSVFCSHGAGFVVDWRDVDRYKHINSETDHASDGRSPSDESNNAYSVSEKELEAIMLREFGPIKRRQYSEPTVVASAEQRQKSPGEKRGAPKKTKKLTIIDGYNFIHADKALRELADTDLSAARESLTDKLVNHAAFTGSEITLVFDAYRSDPGNGSESVNGDCRVVFTKKDQTADAYIEKLMKELGPDYNIRVVTGDGLIQLSAIHSGILRMTAAEFTAELENAEKEISDLTQEYGRRGK